MTARRILRLTWRGLGTLPDYGPHPGVPMALFLIVITTLAGTKAGAAGALFGFVVSVLIYVPLLLYGAFDRARDQERRP